MAVPSVVKGRYEVREILGQGGMGIVYRGYDQVLRREVAIKTLLDISDPASLGLFHREYEVLAHLTHPNVVRILDIGEFEFEGSTRPFFVMPLLPGTSLDKLIKSASQRLTVVRAVDIISQACRGLHAAHEKGMVHRDVKPSNIIVMEDDSVEIIDFGVAHVVNAHSRTGLKGTMYYMAPEQLELKNPSSLSDIFSLGVVAYETMTRRRPFEGATEQALVDAILHEIPPPASDLNPMVNPTLARVIHKAMAKQPYHRFTNARDLADALQKAVHNEPIEIFDPARIRPRTQRATKAYEQADYQFASEIVGELEAEGHISPDLTLLRLKISQAIRDRRLQQLLESARTRMEELEFPLALQKVHEALELDATDGSALALKAEIEARRSESKIEDWMRLASQHMENRAYGHAREALKNVLELKPKDARSLQLLAEIDKREEEFRQVHGEKQQIFQSAMEAWSRGDISAALSKLQRVLELEQRVPNTATPEKSAAYQSFYNQVQTEYDAMRNAYEEAKALLSAGEFSRADAICDQNLTKYRGNAIFQALKFDIAQKRRQEVSAHIAEVDRRVEAEPNLDKKFDILAEASKRFPGEPHFEQALRSTREQRDLVNSIVAKARMLEEHGHFSDALSQWEILRNVYSQYPGLNHETDRVGNRRDQQARLESKTRCVRQIDERVSFGDYSGALGLLNDAKVEFPNDVELLELEKLVKQGVERVDEALHLLEEGQELLASGKTEEGLATLRKAHGRDENNTAINRVLCDSLVEQAKATLDMDWRKAEGLIQEALSVDPGHSLAKSLRTLALDRKRQEGIERSLAEARHTQAQGDIAKALQQTVTAIKLHGEDPRFSQLFSTLNREAHEAEEVRGRRQAMEEAQQLEREAELTSEPETLRSILERIQPLSSRYKDNADYQSTIKDAARRILARLEVLERVTASPIAVPAQPETPSTEGPKAPTGKTDSSAELPPPGPSAEVNSHGSGSPQSPPLVVPGSATVLMRGGSSTGPELAEYDAQAVSHDVDTGGARGRGEAAELSGPSTKAARGPQKSKRRLWVLGSVAGALALLVLVFLGYTVLKEKSRKLPPPHTLPGPPPTSLRVQTELQSGTVLLDGGDVGQLMEGQLSLGGIEAGEHTLAIASQDGRVEMTFKTTTGALPHLEEVTATGDLRVVAVASLQTQAELLSSFGPSHAILDGKNSGEVGSVPLPVQDLSPGLHHLVLQNGRSKQSLSFVAGSAPALITYISHVKSVLNPRPPSPVMLGKLSILTAPGVAVSIDKQPRGTTDASGRLELDNIRTGDHVLSVKSGGYLLYKGAVSLRRHQALTIKPQLMTTFLVTYKLWLRGFSGTLTVGKGKLLFRSKDRSFDYPATKIVSAGAVGSGKDFFVEIHGGKRIAFEASNRDQIVKIISLILAHPKR